MIVLCFDTCVCTAVASVLRDGSNTCNSASMCCLNDEPNLVILAIRRNMSCVFVKPCSTSLIRGTYNCSIMPNGTSLVTNTYCDRTTRLYQRKVACWFCYDLSTITLPFSILTLLDGRQEEHPACKKLSDEVLSWLSVCEVQMICI